MIFYILIFVIGFIGVSLWSAWLVAHPPKIESGFTPESFEFPFEEVRLKTDDGLSIAGWFLPNNDSQKPALIILHGYPAEKGDMLFIAGALKADFNILLIDFRSFGKSEGAFTTLGNKERLDLKAALDFLESRGFGKAGVLGFSLGGAAAILTAPDEPRIGAVVSYASFADLTLLGQEAYRRLFALRYPLVELMKFWSKILWNVDAGLSPQDAAERLQIPIMLVHTKPDEQISFRHAELLREALRDNPEAEFYFPEKGRHGELPGDFEERVKDFFSRRL